MDRALQEYFIGGLKSTIQFHHQIINHPIFRSGDYNTNFIANTPEVYKYRDREPEALRLSRLIAENFGPRV